MESEALKLDLSGASIEAVRYRPEAASGAPLAFLHEGLGSLSLWGGFPRELARASAREALVYSRPGYGRSSGMTAPWPETFMEDHARGMLPEILAAADMGEHVLIGHSDGASIALLHAAERPDGLRGVVAIAPHVFVEECTRSAIKGAMTEYRSGALMARLARHHDSVDTLFAAWTEVWLSERFRDWNIVTRLRAIAVPVLVIQGRDDAFGSWEQVNAIVKAGSGPVAALCVAGGHWPHREQRATVLQAMTAFLQTLRGSAES